MIEKLSFDTFILTGGASAKKQKQTQKKQDKTN